MGIIYDCAELPAGSLVMVFRTENIGFWNYAFPLISISLAGIYDSYGRYRKSAPSNVKLGIRFILDTIAIGFALYYANNEQNWKHYIPAVILLISGGLVLYEAVYRVKTAIEISPWYAKIR